MRYIVKHLIKTPNGWECDLVYWTECYCDRQTEKVKILQENRPLKADVVNAFTYALRNIQ